MRICIIAEGSYPYVTGGVSSWIQTLVGAMPQHEFIIFAIGAKEELRGKFKYKLPDNIVEVKEVFLDSYRNESGDPRLQFNLTPEENILITNFITGSHFDWNELFAFLENSKEHTVSEFLMSKDFFDIIKNLCEEKFPNVFFNDFFWTIRSMILTLFEVLRNDIPKADIYHSVSTGYAGVIASFGKYKYNAPMILTEHGIYTREREEELIKADWVAGYFKDLWIDFFHSLSRCAYTLSDQVVSLFDRNKEIQIELGCPEDKICIISNGVNCKNYEDIVLKKDDDNISNIGAILRVVPIKDVKTIVQGFAIACERMKNIHLYIMGPEDEDILYTEECKSLTKSLDLKNVTFTGPINIKDYVGKMDILVLGSISEGQPLAVLEGMACGKPHILTDVGSCKELMYGRDNDTAEAGIVVPVMDYEALGTAIVKLVGNKNIMEEMGKNAYKRVSEKYTIDNFIESYVKIYDEVVIKL
jgi:glycosyltransferase involved in cell wall biosynthesis